VKLIIFLKATPLILTRLPVGVDLVRGHREFRYGELRRMITQFIQEHREFLIFASTMLELALWKSVLNESVPQHQYTNNDRMIREEIRVNGGQLLQVVIPHVLSFLSCQLIDDESPWVVHHFLDYFEC
jgi:hypothetical protein